MLFFNNAFAISPIIILNVIFPSNFSTFGFKFKTGLHVTIYYLSFAPFRDEWLLRMIFSVCLFKNAQEIISNIN